MGLFQAKILPVITDWQLELGVDSARSVHLSSVNTPVYTLEDVNSWLTHLVESLETQVNMSSAEVHGLAWFYFVLT